jgi:hypothetical protein
LKRPASGVDRRAYAATVLVAVLCVLLVAGVGAAARAASSSRSSVRIELTTYRLTVRRVQVFSLSCSPTGGNLPLAGRICRDIARHPKAMLDPPHSGLRRTSIVCSGGPFMPQLAVAVTTNGGTRRIAGSPGCNWPGNQAIAVYFDAATRDMRYLGKSESELRCDEDPVLFQVPTPLASVVACRHGLWTPRSEQLIRLAERSPALAPHQPARLFPHDIGSLPCAIHAGGAFPGQRLAGRCGVTMKNVWAKGTVSFTEDWPSGSGKTARHIWHVVIHGNSVLANSQSGPPPPQTWP